MKKGKILMIIGGGLLVGYFVVLFVTVSPMYSGVLSWLQGIPLLTKSVIGSIIVGNIKAASLGLVFSAGIITLITGVCLSIFKQKERAKA
jgi:hypothetical protein